jgi:ABC-type multidrug transport system fused ATPase/permease subunit
MGASQSIAYWSYRYFLTVDPIFHTTKSSGQIISKIGRGSNDFIDLMLSILGSIIPVVTGFVTIIITLAKYNLELGVVSLVAFISISIVNGVMGIAGAKSFKKQVIKVQDKVSSVVVENLQQNALIRSTFATTEQDQKNKQLSLDTMVVRATMWLGFGVSITVTRLLYVLASFILAVLIIKFIDQGVLKPEVGLTLLVTFVNGSNQILMLGRTLRDLTDKYLSITDLFDFIRSFGKQTYPVLEGELPPSLTV